MTKVTLAKNINPEVLFAKFHYRQKPLPKVDLSDFWREITSMPQIEMPFAVDHHDLLEDISNAKDKYYIRRKR